MSAPRSGKRERHRAPDAAGRARDDHDLLSKLHVSLYCTANTGAEIFIGSRTLAVIAPQHNFRRGLCQTGRSRPRPVLRRGPARSRCARRARRGSRAASSCLRRLRARRRARPRRPTFTRSSTTRPGRGEAGCASASSALRSNGQAVRSVISSARSPTTCRLFAIADQLELARAAARIDRESSPLPSGSDAAADRRAVALELDRAVPRRGAPAPERRRAQADRLHGSARSRASRRPAPRASDSHRPAAPRSSSARLAASSTASGAGARPR